MSSEVQVDELNSDTGNLNDIILLFYIFKGHVIRDGGALVLGQDQDAWEGQFQQHESFTGQMTRVDVWNKVQNKANVKYLYDAGCQTGTGNVFQWRDFKDHVVGSVKMIRAPRC